MHTCVCSNACEDTTVSTEGERNSDESKSIHHLGGHTILMYHLPDNYKIIIVFTQEGIFLHVMLIHSLCHEHLYTVKSDFNSE